MLTLEHSPPDHEHMQQPADADARVEALGAHACVVLFKGEFKEWREMEVAHEAALAAVKPGGGF